MLKGASGQSRSLIERSWRAACEVGGVDRVVVATDDDRIKITSEAFGAEVVMTPEDCANGTERCAAAHTALGGRLRHRCKFTRRCVAYSALVG